MDGRSTWFERLAHRLIPVESAGVDRQLRLYLALVFVLFVPTAVIFALTDWQRGDRTVAVLVGSLSVILASSIHVVRRVKDIQWGYRGVLIATVAVMTAVIYQGGGGGYAVLWFYVFPGAFYYVFGALEGSVWVLVSAGMPAIVLFTELGTGYPPDLSRRFVVTYLLVGMMSLRRQAGSVVSHGLCPDCAERLEREGEGGSIAP